MGIRVVCTPLLPMAGSAVAQAAWFMEQNASLIATRVLRLTKTRLVLQAS
jgi:hypothetical protein